MSPQKSGKHFPSSIPTVTGRILSGNFGNAVTRRPTPENEARDEYDRRLAFANERFGESRRPGTFDDRGAVYVRNGPPDERKVEADHSQEHWVFHNSQGQSVTAEFVKDDAGIYRLQTGQAIGR